MGRSSNEELESLKATVNEKSRLIDQQIDIINRQLEALAQMNDLQRQLQQCRGLLSESNARIDGLEKEITKLEMFRKRVRNQWFIRLMHWFRDE
ncbi:hypothetical protein JW823_08625 [bacterium]|nr:hypothetical protein [candidate division CSSED10-310 bacterium]